MDDNNEPIDIKQIAEVLELEGVFAEAAREQREQLRGDPEWFLPEWTHLHTLVEAFAQGVISADPWHKNYQLPPNFEKVMNFVAARVWERWGEQDEVIQISLNELEKFYRECVEASPECLAWNESAEGNFVGVVSALSPVPERRDFIDLDALVRNAAVHLRNQRRRERAFDEKFETEWAERGEAEG